MHDEIVSFGSNVASSAVWDSVKWCVGVVRYRVVGPARLTPQGQPAEPETWADFVMRWSCNVVFVGLAVLTFLAALSISMVLAAAGVVLFLSAVGLVRAMFKDWWNGFPTNEG